MAMFGRHELVWLNADGWRSARAAALPAHAEALGRWQRQDWPLVARRRDGDAGAEEVCLGLPLPPDAEGGNKVRIALRVNRRGVARHAAPLPLAALFPAATRNDQAPAGSARPEVAQTDSAPVGSAAPDAGPMATAPSGMALTDIVFSGAAPSPWPDLLTGLARDAGSLPLRVYGSLAMQALTGLPYVTGRSDIDLLAYPATGRQLHAALALLSRYATCLPLDGELIFPSGQAVSWKEWLQTKLNQSRVLVKGAHAVHLADPQTLLATLEQL
jgi:phosphoribosyl-dephospho-CoA transferase